VAGRTFRRDEDRPGGAEVVILGNEVWRSRFAGDAAVVGRSIRVNGIPTTVVGVMPRGFMFPSNADLWRPMANLPAAVRESRSERRLAVVGRMTSAATLESARAELAALDLGAAPARGSRLRRQSGAPSNEQINPSSGSGRGWRSSRQRSGAARSLPTSRTSCCAACARRVASGSIGATRSRVIRLLTESASWPRWLARRAWFWRGPACAP
jgi:hypothetical protein